MSRRSALVLIAVSAIGALCVASAVSAQEDARLAPLLEKFKTMIEDDAAVFLRMHQNVTVNGQDQGEDIQELWIRDLEHFRMEKDDGTLLAFTPEEITLLMGPANVALHIPKESLDDFGEDRADMLRAAGIGEPTQLFDLIEETKEHFTITSEDEIGEECWILSVHEDGLEPWTGMLKGVPDGSDLATVQVALEKETGGFRGFYMELEGAMTLTIRITCPEIDPTVDVTDEMLTMELPEDAEVIEWTADRTGEDVGAEFNAAVAAAMQGG